MVSASQILSATVALFLVYLVLTANMTDHMCDEVPSPSKIPFIDSGEDSQVIESQSGGGPSSPFHALEDSSHEDELKVHQGVSDFETDVKVSENKAKTGWTKDEWKRATLEFMAMSIFAVLGAFLRMVLAQLFGQECKNPGTVGWLNAGQPLCVTSDGETSVEGGIIFDDLPANLLGCFIMGLMQPTNALDLPKEIPVAWLRHNHRFQSNETLHLAIRTGFCGSLTTFSSWNSEMVVMLLGAGHNTQSLIFRGLLGYLIGMETALASFQLGKNISFYLHAFANPANHTEAEETRKAKECGIFINTELPDFERRYLSNFDMGSHDEYMDPDATEHIARWKASTVKSRMVGNDALALLTEIEYQSLVLCESIERENIIAGLQEGWDIDSLNNWVLLRKAMNLRVDSFINEGERERMKYSPILVIFIIMSASLILGLIFMNHDTNFSMTYRCMIFACILSPAGAIVRWKCSVYNGSLKGNWDWLPVGTFGVNLVASIISALMIGIEIRLNGSDAFWGVGTARAIKIGFAGCLSTVSTFISETSKLLKHPTPLRGYIYIFLSLGASCLCGSLCYFGVTHGVEFFNDDEYDAYYN